MAQSAKLGEFGLLYAFAIRAITRSTISGWRRTLRGLSRCWTSNISLWMAASSYASLSRAALNLRALTSPPGIGSCSTCGRWAAIYSDATIQQT